MSIIIIIKYIYLFYNTVNLKMIVMMIKTVMMKVYNLLKSERQVQVRERQKDRGKIEMMNRIRK